MEKKVYANLVSSTSCYLSVCIQQSTYTRRKYVRCNLLFQDRLLFDFIFYFYNATAVRGMAVVHIQNQVTEIGQFYRLGKYDTPRDVVIII